jgi:hypothetical protein
MIWTALLGVVTLMMLARVLGFEKQARLDSAEDAARRAGEALPGFQPAEAVVDDRGRGALVAGRDGRLALVWPLGDRLVVRSLVGARAKAGDGRLDLKLDEPGAPAITLALGAAADTWAKRF